LCLLAPFASALYPALVFALFFVPVDWEREETEFPLLLVIEKEKEHATYAGGSGGGWLVVLCPSPPTTVVRPDAEKWTLLP
jgi:hypothetical protein